MKTELCITKLATEILWVLIKNGLEPLISLVVSHPSKAPSVSKHVVLSSSWHTPSTSTPGRHWCWSVWKEFYLDSWDFCYL